MYLKHFAFTRFPFDKDVPTEEMFVSAGMAELSVRLNHLVELRAIGLHPVNVPPFKIRQHPAISSVQLEPVGVVLPQAKIDVAAGVKRQPG